MKTCHKKGGGRQYWEYHKGVLGRGMYYLTYTKDYELVLRKRRSRIKPTIWNYYYESKQIGVYNMDLCLTHGDDDELTLEECEENTNRTMSQHWYFSHVNIELLEALDP